MTTRERHFLKRNPSPERGRGGRGGRVRQSVWCCGRNYQRWRFIHGEFPGTHHQTCVQCGQALNYDAYFRPRSIKDRARLASRAYQRRQVAAFAQLGLTSKGRPRQRRASVSALEISWRQFRAAMGDITIPDVNATFHQRNVNYETLPCPCGRPQNPGATRAAM